MSIFFRSNHNTLVFDAFNIKIMFFCWRKHLSCRNKLAILFKYKFWKIIFPKHPLYSNESFRIWYSFWLHNFSNPCNIGLIGIQTIDLNVLTQREYCVLKLYLLVLALLVYNYSNILLFLPFSNSFFSLFCFSTIYFLSKMWASDPKIYWFWGGLALPFLFLMLSFTIL